MIRPVAIILTIIALSFLSGPWLPWWSIAPLAALICFLLHARPLHAFIEGFISGLFLWGGLAFFQDRANDQILSAQIGALFNGLSSPMVLVLTGLMGGLVASLGAWSGAAARELFQQTKK